MARNLLTYRCKVVYGADDEIARPLRQASAGAGNRCGKPLPPAEYSCLSPGSTNGRIVSRTLYRGVIMSLSATAATAATTPSTALPAHRHGHKKGVQNDANPESSSESNSTTSGTGTSTTQGLFSSLLSTLEQVVVGASPVAAAAVSLLTPAASTATTATAPTAATAAAVTPSAASAGQPGRERQRQGLSGIVSWSAARGRVAICPRRTGCRPPGIGSRTSCSRRPGRCCRSGRTQARPRRRRHPPG